MSSSPPDAPIDQRIGALIAAMPRLGVVSDEQLRDRLVQFERVVNMAQAEQAEVMTQITRRAGSDQLEFVADEVAITLRTTKPVASHRLDAALGAGALPAVMKAWKSGSIDTRKVQTICSGLADASPIALDTLAEAATLYAQTHTASELRRWVQHRVIASDPTAAESLRQRALADRKVTVTPLPNGLSEFMALLPSVQARQIYDTANAIAYASDQADVRTMDQRRADALVDLVVGRAEPPQVNVSVVMPLDTLLGTASEPATVAGVGPITASQARELATDPEIIRLVTDPLDGHLMHLSEKRYRPSSQLERFVRARDVVCRFPGCSRPAASSRSGTDLDHTVPWPHGQTSTRNLAVLCRHHHRLKHSPGWSAALSDDGGMTWTTPSGKTFTTQPWAYSDPG